MRSSEHNYSIKRLYNELTAFGISRSSLASYQQNRFRKNRWFLVCLDNYGRKQLTLIVSIRRYFFRSSLGTCKNSSSVKSTFRPILWYQWPSFSWAHHRSNMNTIKRTHTLTRKVIKNDARSAVGQIPDPQKHLIWKTWDCLKLVWDWCGEPGFELGLISEFL